MKIKRKTLQPTNLDAIKAMRRGGRDTSKIMRVLNAFYQYLTERDGQEPIPIEVFKERKKTIYDLSKA